MKNEPHFQALIEKFSTNFNKQEKSNARMKIDAAQVPNVPHKKRFLTFFPSPPVAGRLKRGGRRKAQGWCTIFHYIDLQVFFFVSQMAFIYI
jgi:hypothetical protein